MTATVLAVFCEGRALAVPGMASAFEAHDHYGACSELSPPTVTRITAGRLGVAHTDERLYSTLEPAGVVLQY